MTRACRPRSGDRPEFSAAAESSVLSNLVPIRSPALALGRQGRSSCLANVNNFNRPSAGFREPAPQRYNSFMTEPPDKRRGPIGLLIDLSRQFVARWKATTRLEVALICLIVVVLVALALPAKGVYHRQRWSCALCRLERHDYTGLGRRWSEFEETECSRWYRDHILPVHAHTWVRSPSSQFQDLFHRPVAVADRDRPAGLLKFTPAEQVQVYSHIPDPQDARDCFLRMAADMESRDPARFISIRARSGILRDWVSSGFVEPWSDIKQRMDEY